MQSSIKLTGRTRHRIKTGVFGQQWLVLQVEVAAHEIYRADDPFLRDPGEHIQIPAEWRDARVEDLSELSS